MRPPPSTPPDSSPVPVPAAGEATGRFLVVEGVEGAGKSTQVAGLVQWLQSRGHQVTSGREPGHTALGESVRSLLLDPEGPPLEPEAELLLMLAARTAFVSQVVRPALDRGEIVVADRFDLSTLAYQGFGRELDLDDVRRINSFATGGLVPDLVMVLDLPLQEGLRRQREAGGRPDRIESGGDAFLGRVAEGYRMLAASEDQAVLVDASGTVSEVQARLRQVVLPLLPEPLPPHRGSNRSSQPSAPAEATDPTS